MTDRLVPSFLIGGAPRSGTTALAMALDRHPEVAMAKPFIPEPKVFMTEPENGRYLDRYRDFFGPQDASRVRGEKTSYYMENESARHAIRDELPEVKVIFTVREPVERAYSNWLWSRDNGIETLPFAEAIEAEPGRPDPLPDRPYARPFDYLSRCEYAGFARRWYEDLDPDRVGFFLFEDLLSDRAPATLAGVQEFIGLESSNGLGDLPSEIGNETRDSGPALEPALRDELRAKMAPMVEEFAEITGLDVAPWGYG